MFPFDLISNTHQNIQFYILSKAVDTSVEHIDGLSSGPLLENDVQIDKVRALNDDLIADGPT